MNAARLTAFVLAVVLGASGAVAVAACGGDKKDGRARTVTKTETRALDPKAQSKAQQKAAAQQAALAGKQPPGAGAAGLPSGVSGLPPAGGIFSGAPSAGAVPPGAGLPSAAGAGGPAAFEIPDNIKIKIDPSKRLSAQGFCRGARDICREAVR